MAEIEHVNELVTLLVTTTRKLYEMDVTENTDFIGASPPYVREKLAMLEHELRVKRREVKVHG